MADREKILEGLEQCSSDGCTRGCTYFRVSHCLATLEKDALELLKEQQETIVSLQGTICKLNAALAEQPEQKHGHWKQVEAGFTDMMCSECGELALLDLDRDFVLSKYCPNCGARMDGEVEQE